MIKNEKIKELEIQIDIEIIKPYLISKGYDFSFQDEDDQFAYYVARKGNIRYLAFSILRGKENLLGIRENDEYGQIIYDTDGNILLDCSQVLAANCSFRGYRTETYGEFDSSNIFIDDYAIISKRTNRATEYAIYKLKDNKYSLIKEFDYNAKMLKSSSGEVFINDSGKLYGIKKEEYLNDIKLDNIIGIEGSNFDLLYGTRYLYPKIREVIYNKIKNDNLLLTHTYVSSNLYCDRVKDATVFAFLDTDGNIASNLYFKSEYEFCTMDVDNSLYEDAIEVCKEKLNKAVKREIANEKRQETRMRNLGIKADREMLDTVLNSIEEKKETKRFFKVLKDNN